MKYKIVFTIILFFFSYLYLINATNFIKNNDKLMQEIKEKENFYYQEPINAVITDNYVIPGMSGKKVNTSESYKKMKRLNTFNESLLVFDNVYPTISSKGIYNKIIIGNNHKKEISIVINVDKESLQETINKIATINNVHISFLSKINYCITFNNISDNCIKNHQYTLLGYNINNYHLSNTKKIIKNGIVIVYSFNENNYNELNIIIKYLKNNDYQIVSIDELIKE